jgi:P-type conjugative transfer ATPase TrbB
VANSTLSISLQAEEEQRRLEKIWRELGTTIQQELESGNVHEILYNADESLWADRPVTGMELIGNMPASKAESLISSVVSYHRQAINRDCPKFEGELPINGARFTAALMPIVSSPVFSIRLKAQTIFTLADYVQDGIMTAAQKESIEAAVLARKNILVVGGTGTGKTTLTNAIIAEMVRATPHHRLVIIEDTAEIQCAAQNAVLLHATSTVDMLSLLKTTMRLRPDRILVGEVRGPEALALLKAWNTGHPGGVATVHANHAQAGLIRLEQLISEATPAPMQTLIGEAVDIIISIVKTSTGRKVDEVLTVTGYEKGDYQVL